jgi:hypothetical protein
MFAISLWAAISKRGRARQLLGEERGLEIARELELVPIVDLVHELHRDEEAQEEERDEQVEVSEIETVLGHAPDGSFDLLGPELSRGVHREERAEERRGEENAPGRGEPFRQSEEDGVGGAEETTDPPGRPGRGREPGGELLPGLRPVERVEAGQIVAADVTEGLPRQTDPVLEGRHGAADYLDPALTDARPLVTLLPW